MSLKSSRRKFRDADDYARPDDDDVIPPDYEMSYEAIITQTGRFLRLVGSEGDFFCRFMEIIQNLRSIVDKGTQLDIDCPHKTNKTICPYLKTKKPQMRLTKRSLISDNVLAQAMGLTLGEFRYLKKKTLRRIVKVTGNKMLKIMH
jgi:hypothetical protein